MTLNTPQTPANLAGAYAFVAASAPGVFAPGIMQQFFTQSLNFETCHLGASIKVGPYGSLVASVSRGC